MARKKKTDGDESGENQNDSDDTFGLPEIEYKPLDREEESSSTTIETQPAAEVTQPESQRYEYEQKPMEPNPEYTYDPEEESAPVWPKVLGILLVIILAGGAAWYFLMYRPAQEKIRLAKEKQEQEAQKEKDRLAAAEQRAR